MSIDLLNGKIKNIRALIYREQKGSRIFLLTQENSGAYTIPGGCKDLEDADAVSALRRELKEELNLDLDSYAWRDTGIEREYSDLYKSPERAGKATKISIFLVDCTGQEQIRPSDDIMSVEWFDEKTALERLSGAHMKELFLEGLSALKKL